MTPAPLTGVLVRFVGVALVAWGAAGLAAHDQQPAAGAIRGEEQSRERFLRFIDGVLPKRGTVVGVYQAEVPTSGRRMVAFDPPTGAWFSATERFGSDRSANGTGFRLNAESGELKLIEPGLQTASFP